MNLDPLGLFRLLPTLRETHNALRGELLDGLEPTLARFSHQSLAFEMQSAPVSGSLQ
jgi:hypothetical protein